MRILLILIFFAAGTFITFFMLYRQQNNANAVKGKNNYIINTTMRDSAYVRFKSNVSFID